MSVEVSVYERLVGQTLASRYLIESRLGEGAMGAVYKAKHVKVGRAFAVKVLHPRLLEDNKVLQRFEREAELAGRLRHPNVIGVVDVGETPDGLRYMVMDFAEGPDLASLLSEAPMPTARVTNLTRQMLEGLFHAHEQGLIHRDFKPENVIIERDSHGVEVPRIVDFGIAILREGGDSSAGPGRLTTNGLVLGTPHYMAPEQAVADPIDHRIDLFALGIMVYEMMCGKLPFDGSGAEVARANLLLDPPPISERVPHLEVDPLLEAFARRMMQKKRELRPATAKLARDLLDLIGKDRAAAATTLGVSLEDAHPRPMATQDQAPVREHRAGDGTFPPPIREAIATPAQAPAMVTASAVRSREHAIQTQSTEPLATRRRAPLIAAAIVGVGIIGGAALVIFNGGSTGEAKPAVTAPSDKIAMVPDTQPDKVRVEPPPSVVPPPIADTAGSADGSATTGSAQDMDVGVGSAEKPIDKKLQIKSTPKAGTGSGSAVKPPKVETPVVPAVATPIDATTLATQYKTVGAQLAALQQKKGADATSDLWPRYRFVNLSKAMGSQTSRDEANQILTKLATEIKTRLK
jgi:serine/threonine-protein kinase